jgi:DNA-binding NarL/FixJ family response regulator
MQDTIKVFVVARDEPLRRRLCTVLEEARGIAVAGVAGGRGETQGMPHETCCDVVLLDVDMPEAARRQILERSHQKSDARIIVLSQVGQEQQVLDALKNGAMGHVYKESAQTEIIRAIRAVSRGEAIITSTVAGCILDKVRQGQ